MPKAQGVLVFVVSTILASLASSLASAASTERISVDSAEHQADSSSEIGFTSSSVSADGRFVAFESYATNLVPGDTNTDEDIFVRDRQTGTTERVSVSSAGIEADSGSYNFSISGDGRFVAFVSGATNLVTGDTNGQDDVFVHDRDSGVTERIARALGATSISSTGRFVAFSTYAPDLVSGDTNGAEDVFVFDRTTTTIERVSIASGGAEGDNNSYNASISADGRFVAFNSSATNLVSGGTPGLYLRDRKLGVTERIGPYGGLLLPFSADGRFLAFTSYDSLAGNDNNYPTADIYLRDLVNRTTELVSIDKDNAEAAGGGGPSISADGRFVAFSSSGDNLVENDNNGAVDIFVRDRLLSTTERISIDSAGTEVTGDSYLPGLSASGRFVAFQSDAKDLVADDTNGKVDIFMRDRGPEFDNASGHDLAVDFGPAGLWQFLNNATWQKLHNASPVAVGTGDLDGSLKDEVIASFSSGLWARYDNARWKKLHPASPRRFVTGDLDGNGSDELVVAFGGSGLWVLRNNVSWAKLHRISPEDFVTGDLDGNGKDELIVDFRGAGLWVRSNNGWAKLHSGTSRNLATGDLDGNGEDDLIVDFGGAGLWGRFNNARWAKLHNGTSQDLATGDLDGNGKDDLIVDFGGAGLWVRMNNSSWTKLHSASPSRMTVADLDGGGIDDLVVDFGGAGLWVRSNNTSWAKLHNASAQALAAGEFD